MEALITLLLQIFLVCLSPCLAQDFEHTPSLEECLKPNNAGSDICKDVVVRDEE